MIQRRSLLIQLKKLDKLYKETLLHSSDVDLPKYYSRLAVLELGGWIEECIDHIVFYCMLRGRNRLRKRANIRHLKELVKKNYGFHYNNNFREILKHSVGFVVLERVERNMNLNLKQGLESALTKIYPERNDHAHRPIRSAQNFTAPSICISLFNDIYNGFGEYEKKFKKYK